MTKTMSDLKVEIRRLRQDIIDSDIKQVRPYINGHINVPDEKSHLLNHLREIDNLIDKLYTEIDTEVKHKMKWMREGKIL